MQRAASPSSHTSSRSSLPRTMRTGVVARFASLPTIVTVLERSGRHAVGLTLDGVPVTLVVAEP